MSHSVRAIDHIPYSVDADEDRLRRMVTSDRHRPGPAYGRLRKEQLPVWAIIGYVQAIVEASGTGSITEAVIGQVAHDYDVRREAVLASLLYYDKHRHAIDFILEQNATTIS